MSEAGGQKGAAPKAEPRPATRSERQARALGVTPGQGECPDPDAPDYGAQRYLLWNRWEALELVRSPTTLWLSPREPREESYAREPIMSLHDEETTDPQTQKRVIRKVLKHQQTKKRRTSGPPSEVVPAYRTVWTPAGEPYTLNAAVGRQMRYDRDDAAKKAREARAAARGQDTPAA